MKIPSPRDCFKLITKMEMMDHIIDHSVMVSNVSLFLCRSLQKQYPELDANLITSAALLHDITKTRSFDTHEVHSETGGEVLSQLGYPEVGDIIRQHVILDHYETRSDVTVQEIVNYSDKRVLHDQVVSLDKRMEYIKTRYARTENLKKRLNYLWAKTENLEKKIFHHLDITPDELKTSVTMAIKRQDYASDQT